MLLQIPAAILFIRHVGKIILYMFYKTNLTLNYHDKYFIYSSFEENYTLSGEFLKNIRYLGVLNSVLLHFGQLCLLTKMSGGIYETGML